MRASTLIRLPIAVALVTAVGCDSTPKGGDDEAALSEEEMRIQDVSLDAILSDLTPEIMTTSERPVDVDVAIARTFDRNWRLMYEDLGRFFLTDRPSWLSPKPNP